MFCRSPPKYSASRESSRRSRKAHMRVEKMRKMYEQHRSQQQQVRQSSVCVFACTVPFMGKFGMTNGARFAKIFHAICFINEDSSKFSPSKNFPMHGIPNKLIVSKKMIRNYLLGHWLLFMLGSCKLCCSQQPLEYKPYKCQFVHQTGS